MDTNTIRETFQDNQPLQFMIQRLQSAYNEAVENEEDGKAAVQAKLNEWGYDSSEPAMQRAVRTAGRLWQEMNAGAK